MNDYSIISYISFSVFFLFLLILFIYGEFIARHGRAKEGISLSSFSARIIFILLIIIIIFYLTNIISLEKKEIIIEEISPQSETDIPESPAVNFPPPPSYIGIGGYNFSGPFILNQNINIPKDIIFLTLCKEGNEYELLSINYQDVNIPFNSHIDYSCIIENCQNRDNLYFSVFYFKEEDTKDKVFEIIDKNKEKRDIVEGIKERDNFICSVK